jgi:hypothetical protein
MKGDIPDAVYEYQMQKKAKMEHDAPKLFAKFLLFFLPQPRILLGRGHLFARERCVLRHLRRRSRGQINKRRPVDNLPRDRALSSQPWRGGCLTRQEFDLGIPLVSCEPLEGEVASDAARAIMGRDAVEPIGFRVASVSFRFNGEARDSRISPLAEELIKRNSD